MAKKTKLVASFFEHSHWFFILGVAGTLLQLVFISLMRDITKPIVYKPN